MNSTCVAQCDNSDGNITVTCLPIATKVWGGLPCCSLHFMSCCHQNFWVLVARLPLPGHNIHRVAYPAHQAHQASLPGSVQVIRAICDLASLLAQHMCCIP